MFTTSNVWVAHSRAPREPGHWQHQCTSAHHSRWETLVPERWTLLCGLSVCRHIWVEQNQQVKIILHRVTWHRVSLLILQLSLYIGQHHWYLCMLSGSRLLKPRGESLSCSITATESLVSKTSFNTDTADSISTATHNSSWVRPALFWCVCKKVISLFSTPYSMFCIAHFVKCWQSWDKKLLVFLNFLFYKCSHNGFDW